MKWSGTRECTERGKIQKPFCDVENNLQATQSSEQYFCGRVAQVSFLHQPSFGELENKTAEYEYLCEIQKFQSETYFFACSIGCQTHLFFIVGRKYRNSPFQLERHETFIQTEHTLA